MSRTSVQILIQILQSVIFKVYVGGAIKTKISHFMSLIKTNDKWPYVIQICDIEHFAFSCDMYSNVLKNVVFCHINREKPSTISNKNAMIIVAAYLLVVYAKKELIWWNNVDTVNEQIRGETCDA